MKKILLTIAILGSMISLKAQTNYCKDIKTYGSSSTSPLPAWKSSEPTIQLVFVKALKDNKTSISAGLVTNLSLPITTTTDVSVEFDDGDKIAYPGVTVTPMPKGYGTYGADFSLSNADITKFKSKKIKSLSMMNVSESSFSDAYKDRMMGYLVCLASGVIIEDATVSNTNVPAPGAGGTASSTNITVPNTAATASNTDATTANTSKEVTAPKILNGKPIEGFWGIKFGTTRDEAKKAILAKGGTLNSGSSAALLSFSGVTFTQRRLTELQLKFTGGKFYEAVASYPAPDETQVLGTFNTIVSELNAVYGQAEISKSFEPPYADGDGYAVQAIKFGKATIMAIWKTVNNNAIQLQIEKDLSMSLYYTDGTLEKQKDTKKSTDY